jgi:RHS repeat-associated protein
MKTGFYRFCKDDPDIIQEVSWAVLPMYNQARPADYYHLSWEQDSRGDAPDYMFTGMEKDSNSGLLYFGARYYDPSIGRFITPDPMALNYPSLTPYNYCANNPLIYTDPTGAEMDSNDVKDDPAFNELKKSEEGRNYLSEFEEGGTYEKSKLQLTNKYETDAPGQHVMGYYENGEFKKGVALEGVQQVYLIYVGSQNNSTDKTLVSFAGTVDTYLHEIQHAFTKAEALHLTGATILNPEDAISTYGHTMNRYSLFQSLNTNYSYNLSNRQVLRSVTNFVGFSPRIYKITMPKYK